MTSITTKARIFDHQEHGTRLIFIDGPTNPRDRLGKIGIDTHTGFGSAFRDTLSTRVTVIDKKNRESTKTIHFNRSSLVKYLLSIPDLVTNYLAAHSKANIFYNAEVANHVTSSFIYGERDFFYDYVAHNDRRLVKAINIAMQTVLDHHKNKQFQQIYHSGLNDKKFSWKTELTDSTTGKFFSWLYQKTISSFASIKIRFAFANKEKDYVTISHSMARLRYKEAKKDVPAYRLFLSQKPVAGKFSDIPEISKKTYILTNEDWDTHFKGKYPKHCKTDTSTGTTGKPTSWVRSDKEVKVIKKSMNVAREVEFGDRELYYINAFALGPWATGLTVYELMRTTGNRFACGADMEKIINDLEKIYNYEQKQLKTEVDVLIKVHPTLAAKKSELITLVNDSLYELLDDKTKTAEEVFKTTNSEPSFNQYKKQIVAVIEKLNKDKNQIILAGYPPFLKTVADEINKNDDFKKYHVRGVVGGQGISEAARDKLIEAGFSHVNSSYGASDLDINIAAETEFEIKLRKAIQSHPALAYDLYGPNKSTPMVFHYDPFNYLIEADQNDELFFTCVRNDRSSPRVRYDLGDKGRVYAASDIEALLLKHGITDLKPRVNLPLLFVWGRDSAVSFNGSKVAFDDLEHAVTKIDTKNHFIKRAFYKYTDSKGDEFFDILIELNDNEKIPDKVKAHKILRELIAHMAANNQDFRAHLGRNKTPLKLPRLRFFLRNESPISDPGGVRKQVLVFDKNNLPTGYDIHQKSQKSTFSIANDENFLSKLDEVLGTQSPKRKKYIKNGEEREKLI